MSRWELLHADCRAVMANMADDSVDSIVTDPPYHLTSIVKRFGPEGAKPAQHGTDGAYARASRGFMGQTWDGGDVAFDPSLWAEVLRVLKPGGHLLAFSGSRTYHRMAVAIEDAGFEIRDQIMWLYGSGFPKSLDVSKAIDKAAGAERAVVGVKTEPNGRNRLDEARGVTDNKTWGAGQSGFTESVEKRLITAPATPEAQQWEGWGTALKPAHEPIVLARKPLIGTVAGNVLAHGVGGLNIDGCRVPVSDAAYAANCSGDRGHADNRSRDAGFAMGCGSAHDAGRFPANVMHDGSDEVVAGFPDTKTHGGGVRNSAAGMFGGMGAGGESRVAGANSGSAARFFYCAKASKADRGDGNVHPTVKPTALMRYLCRLITPPGGVVFDPFTGSGSTGKAAMLEGFRFIGAEMTDEYIPIARARIASGLKD